MEAWKSVHKKKKIKRLRLFGIEEKMITHIHKSLETIRWLSEARIGKSFPFRHTVVLNVAALAILPGFLAAPKPVCCVLP